MYIAFAYIHIQKAHIFINLVWGTDILNCIVIFGNIKCGMCFGSNKPEIIDESVRIYYSIMGFRILKNHLMLFFLTDILRILLNYLFIV